MNDTSMGIKVTRPGRDGSPSSAVSGRRITYTPGEWADSGGLGPLFVFDGLESAMSWVGTLRPTQALSTVELWVCQFIPDPSAERAFIMLAYPNAAEPGCLQAFWDSVAAGRAQRPGSPWFDLVAKPPRGTRLASRVRLIERIASQEVGRR